MTSPSSKVGRSGIPVSCSCFLRIGVRASPCCSSFRLVGSPWREIYAAIEGSLSRRLAGDSAAAARALLQMSEAAVARMDGKQVLAGLEHLVAAAFERLP